MLVMLFLVDDKDLVFDIDVSFLVFWRWMCYGFVC